MQKGHHREHRILTCRSLPQEMMYSLAECGKKRMQLMVDVWPCMARMLLIRKLHPHALVRLARRCAA